MGLDSPNHIDPLQEIPLCAHAVLWRKRHKKMNASHHLPQNEITVRGESDERGSACEMAAARGRYIYVAVGGEDCGPCAAPAPVGLAGLRKP